MSTTTLQTGAPRPLPRFSGRNLLALLLAAAAAATLYWLPGDLSTSARIALGGFALAIIGWTLTDLNDTVVALLAALGLVFARTIEADGFFASIGESVVWLMIGAFIVARALNQSGLATRFTFAMTRRAGSVGQLFYGLTAVLLMTALVIPSTSARAALLAPVYLAMAAAFQNERLNRALAIALPVNILLTAVGSLVGAGAHLVINDTLGQLVGSRFSFMEWLLLGLPFAAISAFGSTWVILRLFLTREERSLRLTDHLQQQLAAPGPWTRQERYVGLVTLLLATLWMTETWHSIDNALVALMGALAVSMPPFGPLKFKDAAKAVEWEMILFVAASLALSEALVASGAGRWLVDLLLVQSGLSNLESKLAILAGVAAIALTAHLYITSRSARGAALAPLIVLLAVSLDIDPRIMAFVTAAGVGYCITLAVSAKPLTMFQQLSGEHPAYSASDLVRLSSILAPFHLGLILLFALFYWPGLLAPLPVQASQLVAQQAPAIAHTPELDNVAQAISDARLAESRMPAAPAPASQAVHELRQPRDSSELGATFVAAKRDEIDKALNVLSHVARIPIGKPAISLPASGAYAIGATVSSNPSAADAVTHVQFLPLVAAGASLSKTATNEQVADALAAEGWAAAPTAATSAAAAPPPPQPESRGEFTLEAVRASIGDEQDQEPDDDHDYDDEGSADDEDD